MRVGGGQFKNHCFTVMCSGSEAGSYLRLIDFCITQDIWKNPFSYYCGEAHIRQSRPDRGTHKTVKARQGVD